MPNRLKTLKLMEKNTDILTVKMFKIGEPSSAGIIWTKEAVEQMINKFNENKLQHVQHGELSATRLVSSPMFHDNISHITESINVYESNVYVTVKLINTKAAEEVRRLMALKMPLHIQPRTYGVTETDEDSNRRITAITKVVSFDVILNNQ